MAARQGEVSDNDGAHVMWSAAMARGSNRGGGSYRP